jgi:hypothetical protein
MQAVRSNNVPPEFAGLTKKQKRFVRELTWESLKSEAQFIVVIPWVIGCLGALLGIFAGVFLGRVAFPGHVFPCIVICVVMGAGIGAWIGWMWLERECQSHFKAIIRENKDRISLIV